MQVGLPTWLSLTGPARPCSWAVFRFLHAAASSRHHAITVWCPITVWCRHLPVYRYLPLPSSLEPQPHHILCNGHMHDVPCLCTGCSTCITSCPAAAAHTMWPCGWQQPQQAHGWLVLTEFRLQVSMHAPFATCCVEPHTNRAVA